MSDVLARANRLLSREWRNTWIVTWFLIRQTIRVTIVVGPLGLVFADGVWAPLGVLYAAFFCIVLILPTAVEVMHVYDLLCLLSGRQGSLVRALARAGAERMEQDERARRFAPKFTGWIFNQMWLGNPVSLITVPLSLLVAITRKDALETYRADISEAVKEGQFSRVRRAHPTNSVSGEIRIIARRTERIGRAAFALA